MACGDFGSYWQYWDNGQFMDAVMCPFFDPLGQLFPLIFFGGIMIALYAFSDGVILPLVLTLILGSVYVTQLPSVALQLFGIVILLSIAAAGYMLVQRSEGAI